MATLFHYSTNNHGGTTFTQNPQSAPPYNTKKTVDETRRLDDIRRLYTTVLKNIIVKKKTGALQIGHKNINDDFLENGFNCVD
jgi:hypothetical protein